MFKGRTLLIATIHGKEKVMQPLVERALGVKVVKNTAFNTDTLGTFTGEVERKGSAIETLRAKCLIAMRKSQVDLILASEGSFGAHPFYFFTAANEEFVMLKDFKNDIEIVAKVLSTTTNFSTKEIDDFNSLLTFAEAVQFPSHAIILKSDYTNFKYCFKGITDTKTLKDKFDFLQLKGTKIIAETDMRAQYNPSRMLVIEEATKHLITKCKSLCPNCNFPGFDVVEVLSGLPCKWCSSPTESTLMHLYECKKCSFKLEKKYPHDKKFEDPMYCNTCNP
ncbi:DUF6671 family protein [Flavobacterium haoranii]|uniref:DUF6671 domain-containing protein n=1 Tax=Flavobacterium haoranii TaxID=683124 RepID=A0A1M6J0V7_9FLAO|nr:DUF6671 family protein [Flavobacterium haoranii]SHJ40272.1 hypothetical protein SAMN05444337_1932 [Flavobacterium haoranii]